MGEPAKKHPCPDCKMCQWCSDDRCHLCLASVTGCRKKLSMAEQIALFERINCHRGEEKNSDGDSAESPPGDD